MFFHQNATESTETHLPTLCSELSFLRSPSKTHIIKPIGEESADQPRRHDYYKYQVEQSFFYKTKISIKTSIDMENNRYCLLSKAATSAKLLPDTEQLEEVRRRVGYFISASCIYRCDDLLYKYIEIIPYMGKTLASLLPELTQNEKTNLVEKLIFVCLEQVAQKGIVHTDLKPTNICIFNDVMTIIDFDNAHIPELGHASEGLGTAGYLAPEFFRHPQDADRQYELYDMGNKSWLSALKPNFRALFTSATDIFALGQILLYDLELPVDHPYYTLAQQMCSKEADQRPTWLEIKEARSALAMP